MVIRNSGEMVATAPNQGSSEVNGDIMTNSNLCLQVVGSRPTRGKHFSSLVPRLFLGGGEKSLVYTCMHMCVIAAGDRILYIRIRPYIYGVTTCSNSFSLFRGGSTQSKGQLIIITCANEMYIIIVIVFSTVPRNFCLRN